MLTFDESRHAYQWCGTPVPGVTEVIASAGLIAGLDWMDEASRIRGQAVHRACELDDKGALDESTVDDIVAPYLAAWRKFTAEHKPTWHTIEERVYNTSFRYAGTVDRAGRLAKHRARCVVDIKTGMRSRATGVQLAAYAAALFKTGTPVKRIGVYLRPTGQYELETYTAADAFATFLAALHIANWKAAK
jgi:hypothetical protein